MVTNVTDITNGPVVEDIMQEIVDLMEYQRELDWGIADTISRVVWLLDNADVPIKKAHNLIGQAAGKSAEWVKLQKRISRMFPPEYRWPTLDWFSYRMALESLNPLETITLAHDNQWSARQIRAHVDAERDRPGPRTSITVEGVLNWEGKDLTITPERYGDMRMADGTNGVKVTAQIKGHFDRKKTSE